MTPQDIRLNVQNALSEDLGGQDPQSGDITAALIPAEHHVTATIITREDAVMAGIPWAQETFDQVDSELHVTWHVADGERVRPNQTLCTLKGRARSILTAERTALNFIQTLSAVATVTAEYAELLSGTDVKILDTRKTLPGLRVAQKYAVKCGGGQNHRMGLYDAFLIKENHILACGSIRAAVEQARVNVPGKPVEVEVESLEELQHAIDAAADIVMLDNFSLEDLRKAVALNQGKTRLEVSGNITKTSIVDLRDTGIDFISSGALTKHVQAIDLSLRIAAG